MTLWISTVTISQICAGFTITRWEKVVGETYQADAKHRYYGAPSPNLCLVVCRSRLASSEATKQQGTASPSSAKQAPMTSMTSFSDPTYDYMSQVRTSLGLHKCSVHGMLCEQVAKYAWRLIHDGDNMHASLWSSQCTCKGYPAFKFASFLEQPTVNMC